MDPSIASKNQLAYVGKKPESRDSDSWFTPAEYIEKARSVLGEIELDPFSCSKANEIVRAKRFFSIDDNALNRSWSSAIDPVPHVWMNPPYGRNNINLAIEKFIFERVNGRVGDAIVLVNNATETEWFAQLLDHCNAFCIVRKRIAFWNADNKRVSGNTRGQVFFYFGRKIGKFAEQFGSIGKIGTILEQV